MSRASRVSVSPRTLFVLSVTLAASSGWAEESRLPAWQDPDVLRAAIAIDLTPEQQPEFRRIVTEYLTELGVAVQKEMRRESVNKDRTIRRRDNALVKRMDEEMRVLLTEVQWPLYEIYRDTLRAEMQDRAESR